MHDRPANVVILGATGSIGRQALEVIEALSERFRVVGLTAHRNTARLGELARRHHPEWVVVTDGDAEATGGVEFDSSVTVHRGDAAIAGLVAAPHIDIVVAAMVGSAGVRATWAAAEAGKRIALANKESLVMAGPRLVPLARQRGAAILPVDSEHSAVFQCLAAGRREEVRRIVLTASGGPFLRRSLAELEQVTIAEALAHPTWSMGGKITIDSATMMNKALEIIEARWLFDLSADEIEVVIHPQSIVHSFVEFRDGSVMAQLSPPDMRLPIQYALTFPDRCESPARKLDWREKMSLEFEPADLDRFDALRLGLQAARDGGTTGAVLSAANEAAVAAFLAGELSFSSIVPTVRRVVEHHTFDPSPALEALFAADRWARAEVWGRGFGKQGPGFGCRGSGDGVQSSAGDSSFAAESAFVSESSAATVCPTSINRALVAEP
jgi:1-deoxy-D-xylulose-5-phosphate reductoisomerase